MATKHIGWIDTLKGIGILLVVAAHVFEGRTCTYASWFHLPLFFFISGYLYKPSDSSRQFMGRRARHLLIPYATYLVLLSVPGYVSYVTSYLHRDPDTGGSVFLWFTAKLLWGGTILGAAGGEACRPIGIFWFISCLFLTQIAYNALHQRLRGRLLMMLPFIAAAYVLAMLDSADVDDRLVFGPWRGALRGWAYPWCVNVVLPAIVYFFLGDVASRVKPAAPVGARKWVRPAMLLVSAIVAAAALILNLQGVFDPRMGMKFARYGIPGVSLALTVSLIALSHELAKAISRSSRLRPLNILITECGKASMIIMFVHTMIYMEMAKYPALADPWLGFAVSVTIPYALYRLFRESRLARRLFLGLSRPVAGTGVRG